MVRLYDSAIGNIINTRPKRFRGRLSRVGVFPYVINGRLYWQYRPADEVFSELSVQSLLDTSLTIGHPDRDDDPENCHGAIFAVDPKPEEGAIDGELMTLTDSAESLAKSGSPLSPMYDTLLREMSGTFEGQPYDLVQTNIRYTSMGFVGEARQGDEVKIFYQISKDSRFGGSTLAPAPTITVPDFPTIKLNPEISMNRTIILGNNPQSVPAGTASYQAAIGDSANGQVVTQQQPVAQAPAQQVPAQQQQQFTQQVAQPEQQQPVAAAQPVQQQVQEQSNQQPLQQQTLPQTTTAPAQQLGLQTNQPPLTAANPLATLPTSNAPALPGMTPSAAPVGGLPQPNQILDSASLPPLQGTQHTQQQTYSVQQPVAQAPVQQYQQVAPQQPVVQAPVAAAQPVQQQQQQQPAITVAQPAPAQQQQQQQQPAAPAPLQVAPAAQPPVAAASTPAPQATVQQPAAAEQSTVAVTNSAGGVNVDRNFLDTAMEVAQRASSSGMMALNDAIQAAMSNLEALQRQILASNSVQLADGYDVRTAYAVFSQSNPIRQGDSSTAIATAPQQLGSVAPPPVRLISSQPQVQPVAALPIVAPQTTPSYVPTPTHPMHSQQPVATAPAARTPMVTFEMIE